MDYPGIAILIAAISAAIVTVGGFILSAIRTLRDDLSKQQTAVAISLAEMGVKLDGQASKLNDALAAANRAKGKEEGIKEERADPQVAAGSLPAASGAPTVIQTPSLQVQASDIQVQKTAPVIVPKQ